MQETGGELKPGVRCESREAAGCGKVTERVVATQPAASGEGHRPSQAGAPPRGRRLRPTLPDGKVFAFGQLSQAEVLSPSQMKRVPSSCAVKEAQLELEAS